MKRSGEKFGWIFGLIGSFLWVPILALVQLSQKTSVGAVTALLLAVLALLLIRILAPWRRPETQQWKLMLPFYLIGLGCAAAFICDAGGLEAAGINPWLLLSFLPLLTPLLIVGGRKWNQPR